MELFTDTYTGKQFNYVADHTYTEAVAREIVDHGVTDNKGRAIGATRSVTFQKVTLSETKTRDFGGQIWPVGKPLEFFEAVSCNTRNGAVYGSARMVVQALTCEEALAELDKRIAKSKVAMLKKFGTK